MLITAGCCPSVLLVAVYSGLLVGVYLVLLIAVCSVLLLAVCSVLLLAVCSVLLIAQLVCTWFVETTSATSLVLFARSGSVPESCGKAQRFRQV